MGQAPLKRCHEVSGMKIRDIGEIGLIKTLARMTKCDASVVRGIGDDTAVMRWHKDKYLLFTCDMLVEDVHFSIPGAAPEEIGYKALARNISDIAAMGGLPRYALVSAALPPELPASFAQRLYHGIVACGRRFGVNIVGGDTCRSDKLVLDVSMIGEVERKKLVLRSGARPGDIILVTGRIGGSIKGKHLRFIPRLAEARKLVSNFKINSMIDISDGLILDLWRILEASGAGARIYKKAVPLSKDADSFDKAIYDGEDFELLFTMKRLEAERLLKKASAGMKTPVAMIGEVTDKKQGYILVRTDGTRERLKPRGFLHF